MDTANCPKCQQDKSLDLFSRDGNWHNGRFLWCKPCAKQYAREQYRKHAVTYLKRKRAYHKAVKEQVFTAYGKSCQCCGETTELFLDIDHMDNNGAVHRKQYNLRAGTQFYMWLIKNNFPANFQTLCCNCNRGKFRNNGVCPHKEK